MKKPLEEMTDEQFDRFMTKVLDGLVNVFESRGAEFLLVGTSLDGNYLGSVGSKCKVGSIATLRDLAKRFELEWIESN